MADITSPIALDESFNTTETTPRNIADVVADETGDLVTQATAIVTKLQALINAVKPNASDIPLDPITGMSANNVQLGISELKGTLDGLIVTDTYNSGDQSCYSNQDFSINIAASKQGYTPLGIVGINMTGNYSTRFSITRCMFTTATNIQVSIRANSSESFSTSNLKITCTVLFIKS